MEAFELASCRQGTGKRKLASQRARPAEVIFTIALKKSLFIEFIKFLI